ncbi:MAG: hypothetical protein WC977_13675 [Anaerovoracaceae bacterium]
MEPQKEIEYLREKVALLEKCLEYERLLRDMREAAPKEPVYAPYTPWVPAPYEVPRQPWESPIWVGARPTTTGEPYHYWDTVTIC